ncbi:RDD family protein [Acidipropionibacterium jensenii]|uniref:RDD family n=1 Tax=Acidipropionibacterium jensenii TaxID=1749 RepID=A0A448NXD6_9ACTN|nr:RDD family protein [Acidipropionibacterium jensenii]MDN5976319.1 RDD family protein [Acidipropionibacterium jensenii]MDN5995404.1 RDD family protein [Acidipropionibacterium jensenii]MDN6426513.1 RDD family protein [Acidipropionibacterium jensenii]MDN6441207.1 RDD family protein [Acidipropionibacterium jensenii]MDN6479204.1 RDD family protein [Acidipropionibacterium jensenii]
MPDTSSPRPAASQVGAALGLPATGRGSLAPWNRRLAALLLDWAASMVVAIAVFGVRVIRDQGWPVWMPMAVFFVERTILTALASASFGQLLAHVAVVRVDSAAHVGWWRSAVRTALKCLVIPAVIIGADRRGLDDLMLGTVVVNRR